MRADTPDGFVAAFERLGALLQSPDVLGERRDAHGLALVEGFIAGREYALEGLLHHGRLQVLALFDKPDPLDGPFFEETIYVTPSVSPPDVQEAIAEAVARAADAIGLRHGPVHAECRVNDLEGERAGGRVRARGRGASDRRPLRAGAAVCRRGRQSGVDPFSRSKNSSSVTRSANRRRAGVAKRGPRA